MVNGHYKCQLLLLYLENDHSYFLTLQAMSTWEIVNIFNEAITNLF